MSSEVLSSTPFPCRKQGKAGSANSRTLAHTKVYIILRKAFLPDSVGNVSVGNISGRNTVSGGWWWGKERALHLPRASTHEVQNIMGKSRLTALLDIH